MLEAARDEAAGRPMAAAAGLFMTDLAELAGRLIIRRASESALTQSKNIMRPNLP